MRVATLLILQLILVSWTADAAAEQSPMRNDRSVDISVSSGSQLGRDRLAAQPAYYRSTGQKFLAENRSQKDIITLPSGLQYKILASGAGRSPKGTDAVLVAYQGRTVDGQIFSSSASAGMPIPQEVVVNKTIPGWVEALLRMREGDHWRLYIPHTLAYRRGGPMRGKAVVFDLKLLEVLPEFR